MTTTTRYVNTASSPGGDGTTNNTSGTTRAYASLSEAESSLQGSYTDLVEIICSGSTADTNASIDGWTLSGSAYILIRGASTSSGKWDTSKYRLQSTDANALYINEAPIRLQDLQIAIDTSSDSGLYCVQFYSGIESGSVYVERCIFRNITATTGVRSGIYWYTSGGIYYIGNNVFYDLIGNNASNGLRISDAVTAYVYHNTFCGNRYGVYAPNSPANVRLKNNLFQDNTYSLYNNSGTAFNSASNYNVADDAGTSDYLIPGANNTLSTEITFIDESGDDFHANDTNAQVANCLYSDSSYAITTDIDNAARPSSGSVYAGADEALFGFSPPALTATTGLFTPSVDMSPSISPSTLELTGTVIAPSLASSISPSPGALATTGELVTPSISIGNSHAPIVSASIASLSAPTIYLSASVACGHLSAAASLLAPSVDYVVPIEPIVLNSVSSVMAPSVSIGPTIQPPTQGCITTLLVSIVTGTSNVSIAPATLTANAVVIAPTLAIASSYIAVAPSELIAKSSMCPIYCVGDRPLRFNPNLNRNYSNLPERLRELSWIVIEIERRLKGLYVYSVGDKPLAFIPTLNSNYSNLSNKLGQLSWVVHEADRRIRSLAPPGDPPVAFNPKLNSDYSNLPERLVQLSLIVNEIERRLKRLE